MVLLRPVDRKDWEQDFAAVKELAKKYEIEVLVRENSEYQDPADMTKPQFSYTMNCIRRAFPAYPVAPMILPAGTDARTLTAVCPCVLRFTPTRFSKEQMAGIHAEDEHIDIGIIPEAIAFYRDFVLNYC